MLIEVILFCVSLVFLVPYFNAIASLSNLRHFTSVAREFLYPTLLCSCKHIGTVTTSCECVPGYISDGVIVSVRVVVSVL